MLAAPAKYIVFALTLSLNSLLAAMKNGMLASHAIPGREIADDQPIKRQNQPGTVEVSGLSEIE